MCRNCNYSFPRASVYDWNFGWERLELPREEAPVAVGSLVGANAERWEKPLRHEATMVLEPLQEEAPTAVLERPPNDGRSLRNRQRWCWNGK